MSEFNKRINQIKDERNLSVQKMAKMIGIPATTMSTYLKDREPKFDTLIKISEVFEVSPLWLIGHSENRTGQSKAHEQQKKKKYRVTFEISVEEIE